ncbi:MAG: Spy/CpxP family protein refolding chaperone [Phycisphaerales bacterium]
MKQTLAAAVVALVLAASVAAPARAQGTSGAFPDPISSREMDRFAKQLGLDEAARRELEPFHDAYRQSLRELREGAIAAYLKESGAIGMGLFGPQRSRAEVEAAVKRRSQILDQIEKAEKELFDRIQPGLQPTQAAMLPRVRAAAARERLRGLFGPFSSGGINVEVGEIVDELELAPEQRQAVAPIVDEHERKLTRLLGDLATLNIKQPLAMVDGLAAAGVKRPESLDGANDAAGGASPERLAENQKAMEDWFRQMGKVRSQVTAPQREKREAIAKLNRETVVALRSALPSDAGTKLFERFVQKAYGQIGTDGSAARPLFARATKLGAQEAAGDPAVAALRAAAADYQARYDKLLADMMDEVDSSRHGFDLFVMDEESSAAFEKHEKAMQELRERRDTMNKAAADQIRGILGPELATKLGPEGAGERRTMSVGGIPVEAGGVLEGATIELAGGDGMEIVGGDGMEIFAGDGAVMVTMTADGPGPGAMPSAGPLPTAISVEEMRGMSQKLGVPEEQRAVLDILHEEYLAAFDGARQEERDAMNGIGGGPNAGAPVTVAGGPAGPGGFERAIRGPKPMTPEEIDKRSAAFRRAVERLLQIDSDFFENLAAVLAGSPAAARVAELRSARERAVLTKGARGPGGMMPLMMIGGGGGKEAEIDLGEILDRCDLSREARSAAGPALERWSTQATGLVRQRFETCLAAQRDIDKFNARAMNVSEGGRAEVNIDSNDPGFAEMQKAQARIASANRQLSDFNRDASREIMAALPPEAREPFRRAFNRAAHPMLFRDRQTAQPKLDAAIAVADLTDAQRLQLSALAAEHAAAYEKLCDQMVEAEVANAPTSGTGEFDAEAIRALQAKQNELKKLRFDRTELNASTLKKIGAILTPEQLERIGGVSLPEAKERGTIQFGA